MKLLWIILRQVALYSDDGFMCVQTHLVGYFQKEGLHSKIS